MEQAHAKRSQTAVSETIFAVKCGNLSVKAGFYNTDVDAFLPLLYSWHMSQSTPQSVTEQELQKLEVRLEELVNTIARLKDENRSLRNQQDSLVSERANLIEKNETARTRVEAMINRLKAMEQGA